MERVAGVDGRAPPNDVDRHKSGALSDTPGSMTRIAIRTVPFLLTACVGFSGALALGPGPAHAQQPQAPAQPAPPPAQTDQPGQTQAQAPAAPKAGDRLGQLEEQIVDLQVALGTLQTLVKGGGAVASPGAPGGLQPGSGGDLALRLDVVETQIRALTGQIEQIAGQLAGLQARLGGGAAAVAPAQPQGQPAPATPPGGQQQGFGTTTVNPGQPGAAAGPGSVQARPLPPVGAPGAQEQTAAASATSAESLYEQAYGHLVNRDYQQAETGFRRLLEAYPQDALAANASYWLGETYYVRGQYRKAANTFLGGYKTYRESAKAADSLLKLSMSLNQLGERDAACATLDELLNRMAQATPQLKARASAERRRIGCR